MVMKTLYEVYIVKEDNFINYKIVNDKIVQQDMCCDGSHITNPNKEGISVYVNGEELAVNYDYTMFNGELNFSNPLSVGDKIIVKASILNNVKLITKNSYSRNALFKYYSSNAKLKSSQAYDFVLNINGEEFTSKFLSKYDPFYTTIEKIRIDTGDLLINVPDYQIAKIII